MNIEPMLLDEVEDKSILEKKWIFQIKENGIRALIHIKDHKIVGIRGRGNNPLLYCFPEFKDERFNFDTAILDAEIVVYRDGKSVFYKGIDQRRSVPDSRKLKDYPASIKVFDIIQLERDVLIYKPYKDRLAILQNYRWGGEIGGRISLVETSYDGNLLWDKVVKENQEGLVAKNPGAIYELGKRSVNYLKAKNYKYCEIVIATTEKNNKGYKITGKTKIEGTDILVTAQIFHPVEIGMIQKIKYLDIFENRLIQPVNGD